jgi:aminoglycoside phosphotransferase (APT) family kinase protein
VTATRRPAAELAVDPPLVRRLLAEQHADLAALPLRPAASGWDNVMYRLGDDLAVRLPRRAAAAPLIANELRWLPQLADRLPLPVPSPVRGGTPGAGYPWPWAVTPWLPGRIAADAILTRPPRAAHGLGRFVAAPGRPAPPDAPANAFRGVPLLDRQPAVLERLDRLGSAVDSRRARAVWSAAVAVPPWAGAPVWLHGDLHPANLLVDRGALTAVIDFGDLTAGDPGTDLSVAWMLFGPDERAVFRAAAGQPDDETWTRARGNALAHAIACLASSADDRVIAGIGRRTLANVLDDDG